MPRKPLPVAVWVTLQLLPLLMLVRSLTLCLWRGPTVVPARELLALPLTLQLQQQQQESQLSTRVVQKPVSLSSSPRRDRYSAHTASLSASTLTVLLQLCVTTSVHPVPLLFACFPLLQCTLLLNLTVLTQQIPTSIAICLCCCQPKQIAELVLLYCVFLRTALPLLRLALVVQTTLPVASPEQLEAPIAKAASGGRAGAVSFFMCPICPGTET